MNHYKAIALLKSHGAVISLDYSGDTTVWIGQAAITWRKSEKGNVTSIYYRLNKMGGWNKGCEVCLIRVGNEMIVRSWLSRVKGKQFSFPDCEVFVGPDIDFSDCRYTVRIKPEGRAIITLMDELARLFARQVCDDEMPKGVFFDWLKEMGHIE